MLMDKITHAPINLYFDVTPVGRILGHFNRDVGTFNRDFLRCIQDALRLLQNGSYSLYCVVSTVPMLMVLLPYNLYFRVHEQNTNQKVGKILRKLEPAADERREKLRSSNVNGLTVIRAFNKEEELYNEYSEAALKKLQFRRMIDSYHHGNRASKVWFNMSIKFLTLAGIYAHRGPGMAFSLILAMNQFNSLTHQMMEARGMQER